MGYRLECLCMVLLAQLHRTVSVEFKVLGPVGDIVAVAGEDVILPCYLKPSINAVDSRVKWNHLNTVIHHYQDRTDRSERQNPSYKERTALFKDELKQGNTSLKLMGVKISDEGIYICIVQYKGSFDDVFMKVIVTVIGSQPVISTEEKEKGTVGLKCEAKGWYPEPELVWQDSKGQTLSTGPPEIHRDAKDPEGPYTVISRIVVPEGDNIFTCGVHMKLINHTKKAEIHTTGDPVAPINNNTMALTMASLSIPLLALSIFLTVFLYWRKSGESEFGRIRRLYAVDVTLNPLTAPPALHISDNGKKVKYEATPDNSDCCLSVLGKEEFHIDGKYYFEVQINRSNEYALGVSKGSAGDNCVTVELKGGGFWSVSKKPLKVGIYVELDGCGQVSFYNVKKEFLIQSYSCQKFNNEIIYPYFKLGKEKGNALTITPVDQFTSFGSSKPQFRRQSNRECGPTSHIELQPINQQASVNVEEIC